MALSPKDKEWIAQQHIDAHKGRSVATWLKQWGIFGAVITGAIALLAIAITSINFAISEVRNNSEFRGRTTARLDNIEAQLRNLRASVEPRKVLQELATFDPPKLAGNLSTLKKVAEQPIGQLQLTRDLILTVNNKLRMISSNSDEYWPTVLQFLRLASSSLSASKVPPPDAQADMDIVFTKSSLSDGGLENKIVTLDDASISRFTFVRCRVRFIGKPVHLENVAFIDCVFDFSISTEPPEVIKSVSQQLLASDLRSVKISV